MQGLKNAFKHRPILKLSYAFSFLIAFIAETIYGRFLYINCLWKAFVYIENVIIAM